MTIRDANTIAHMIITFYGRMHDKYDGTDERNTDYCIQFTYAGQERYLSYEYNEDTGTYSIALRDSHGNIIGPVLASKSFDDLHEQLNAISEASYMDIKEEDYQ